ncbi:DUF4339 domain-containing protein [Rhizobium sp. BR 314]|uniref:DUF4339 domain-containing protein n=1 Tax=Rhizobium sp. BR 314 TaxID=3040013 RepID=UPI0039BFB95F
MNWHYNLNGTSIGPVGREKLDGLIDDGTLNENTLVWNDTFGSDWRRIGDVSDFRDPSRPPPLPLSAVNDFWVWVIAFVPIIGTVIEAVVAGNDMNTKGAVVGYAVANALFSYLDEKSIRKSGRKVPVSWGLGLFLAPAYLFVRAKRLGKNQATLLVWVASIIASVYIPQALSGVYLGVNIPSCSSSTSVSQIKDLFPRLPINIAHTGVVDVKNFSTLQETDTHRTCTATVEGTDGNSYPVKYTIDNRNNEYYYYLQLNGL